jgi:hypothetical protein
MNPAGKTLSYGEEKALRERIQDLKDAQGGKELVQGVNMSSPNLARNRAELQRLQNILNSQGVSQLSKKELDEAEKEEKVLRDDLQKGMPSWDRYVQSRPKDGPRHDKIVEWIVDSDADPIRQQKVKRWKSLRRHINPNDPKFSHTNRLFPE